MSRWRNGERHGKNDDSADFTRPSLVTPGAGAGKYCPSLPPALGEDMNTTIRHISADQSLRHGLSTSRVGSSREKIIKWKIKRTWKLDHNVMLLNMVVSRNRGTQYSYYDPYYGEPKNGIPNFWNVSPVMSSYLSDAAEAPIAHTSAAVLRPSPAQDSVHNFIHRRHKGVKDRIIQG